MKDSIEYIAYLVNKAKKENLPRPIIFLGAGASSSAGIPLAKKIVYDIKDKYFENPLVKEFVKNDEQDYYKVIGALTADERRDLFYSYITKADVKINLTNLYLAQLLKEEYIDFILTVNFDDLILRGCALFNFLPPVYDVSNVKVPTTSNFRERSVIYLHGQHFGQWLLNEPEELKKVNGIITNIFNEIKNKRTWIVVGYSGKDEIFEQIVKLGSFTSDLFWINYKDSEPDENIIKRLISKQNSNAHLIKGYDSDTFFLNLHSQLGLETPELLNKPFSFLKKVIKGVKDVDDIEENEHKEKYKSVKERLDISNSWIEQAIVDFEEKDSVEKFKQEIIEATLKGEFEKNFKEFTRKIELPKFKLANIELADYFIDWGVEITKNIKSEDNENLLLEAKQKEELAIKYNPKSYNAYNNLGSTISFLAKLKKDKLLFKESFKKYKKASELDSKNAFTYNNWAIAISNLAELERDEILFKESFNKFKIATELNTKYFEAYHNWGIAISDLAEIKKDKDLYKESFEKYKTATEINTKYILAFDSWSSDLLRYSYLVPKEDRNEVYNEALICAEKAYSLDKKETYNLACCYSLLMEKENALRFLEIALENEKIKKEDVIKDNDWNNYKEDFEFLNLIEKY